MEESYEGFNDSVGDHYGMAQEKEAEIPHLEGGIEQTSTMEALIPTVDMSNDDESTSDESDFMHEEYFPPYDFRNHDVVKTSDRILDDLRNSPLFLMEGQEGILSKPTIEYHQKLANKVAMSQLKYQMFHFDPKGKTLHPYSSESLLSGGSVSICDGIIAPLTDSTSSDFTELKLFHYRVKVKSLDANVSLKSTFHMFRDDELNENDRKLLIENRDEILESFKVFDEIPNDIFKSSNLNLIMPRILDSANYISNETQTIIRIEVYPSVLTKEDLQGFTLTEIQTRAVTYNSTAETDFEGDMSTPRSLHKLYNSLVGPFRITDTNEKPAIKLRITNLDVFLDVPMLQKKFLFVRSFNQDDIEVLTPQYFSEWGNYQALLRHHYQRALLECQYLLTLFEPTEKPKIKMNIDRILELINDSDITKQKPLWINWSKRFYTPEMILLSAVPYYDVNTVTNMFYNYASDTVNNPLYFDALVAISKTTDIHQLGDVVMNLRRTGNVGYSDLLRAFQTLGLTNVIQLSEMYTYDPMEILAAYKAQIAISNTKGEKRALREHLQTISCYKRVSVLSEYLFTEPFFEVGDAYNLLNVTPDKEDDWILTMYTSSMSDHTMSSTTEYARALLSIAIHRRSLNLMNFIAENIPQFLAVSMTTEQAFNVLGLYTTADDETIIRVFQNRAATDVNANYRDLWIALKVAAEEKKSDLIVSYMRTGIINSSLLSVERTPAGIENIGNTCYLNSLLQYYFVIKPFRDYVLNFDKSFDAEAFKGNEMYQKRRIGGRNAGFNETQRSYQFVHKLKELYFAMIHEDSRCVIPKRELAFLAFSPIEQVVNITTASEETNSEDVMDITVDQEENKADEPILIGSSDSETDENLPENSSKDEPVVIGTPLRESSPEVMDLTGDVIEAEAVTSDKPVTATAMISDEDYQFAIEQSGQQDVTECIQNVLAQTETAMDPDTLDEDNEQLDTVKELFFGKTKQTLSKVDRDTMREIPGADESVKIERFLNLIVSLEDHPKNIYDALDSYFRADLLDYDNESVKRSLTITELPSILQVQIQRVQYDRELFRPVKNIDPLPFDSTIYMDRYMETDDSEILAKREESFQWRVRLNELKSRLEKLTMRGDNGMTIKDSLISAKAFFESAHFKSFDLQVDSNTLEVLQTQISKIDTELMDINDEMKDLEDKLLHQFDGFKKVGYSVFAAFIHRGSATYGHYWIYIMDPKNGVWRVYNDETVSEVSQEVVFDFAKTNTATPYYLVFVREDMVDEIEPLRREIVKRVVKDDLMETLD